MDTVRIGPRTYGWNSVRYLLDGIPLRSFTEFSWDEKIELALGYALGQHYAPQARTAGKYVPDPFKSSLITHALPEFNQILLNALARQGLAGSVSLKKAVVSQQLIFDEPGLGPITIDVVDTCLVHRGMSIKEGPELFTFPLEFSAMRYLLTTPDGVTTTLWDSDETGPV